MSGKLVLVTGVTGFIAGHVALAFLEAGYRVRGTTRGAKAKALAESIKVSGLEFARIDDVATSNFSEALKDVDILVHVASPLPGMASVDETLNTAVDGTLNVLKQAAAVGIEKIVVTSSISAVLPVGDLLHGFKGLTISDSDWGTVTKEQVYAKAKDPFYVYFASKILAERAVWQFAKEHPEVDIATILPSFVFGPYAPHFPLPSSPEGLGTNSFIRALMTPNPPLQPPPWFVDVRDVAKAHLKVVSVPRVRVGDDIEKKRFLINGWIYTWRDAAADLNARRPDVITAAQGDFTPLPGPVSTLDTTRAREILGMTTWIDPRRTVEETVDSLRETHKTWAESKL
ncbi:NAD(P)-binding protein [Pluteus cervinus]|uniref:NAD(P)-binding protein n=1 Tax=Pluteus cervinus TaxID=181527 RepID=A0ACD3AKH5_9AGAR|nr:NAD(P)-binding protein [Pluteus cervinus]